MKKTLVIIFLIVSTVSSVAFNANAQNNKNAPAYKDLKIVFQLTSADTVMHHTFMGQLKNYLSVAPELKIEVVCHSGGLSMLVQSSCVVQDEIKAFMGKGVKFVACEFTMKKRMVTKDQLIAGAGTVTSGVLEIAKKQQEGWSYIKL